jgi:hypothetical protein
LIYAGGEGQPSRENLLSRRCGGLTCAIEGRRLHSELNERSPSTSHCPVRLNMVKGVKLTIEGQVIGIRTDVLSLDDSHPNREEQKDQQ